MLDKQERYDSVMRLTSMSGELMISDMNFLEELQTALQFFVSFEGSVVIGLVVPDHSYVGYVKRAVQRVLGVADYNQSSTLKYPEGLITIRSAKAEFELKAVGKDLEYSDTFLVGSDSFSTEDCERVFGGGVSEINLPHHIIAMKSNFITLIDVVKELKAQGYPYEVIKKALSHIEVLQHLEETANMVNSERERQK